MAMLTTKGIWEVECCQEQAPRMKVCSDIFHAKTDYFPFDDQCLKKVHVFLFIYHFIVEMYLDAPTNCSSTDLIYNLEFGGPRDGQNYWY